MASMIEILHKKIKLLHLDWTEPEAIKSKVELYVKDQKQFDINNISDPKNGSRVHWRVVFLSARHKFSLKFSLLLWR